MGDTKIEWATKTWNPLRGCSKVSEGCRNCYAIRVASRFGGEGMPYEGLTQAGPGGPNWTGKIKLALDMLDHPLRWRNPQRVFVNSMSDLFHPDVPDDFIDQVFAVMALCPEHTFMILTKRPARMLEYIIGRQEQVAEKIAFDPPDGQKVIDLFGGRWIPPQIGDFGRVELAGYFDGVEIPWPLPNVWLGVSVENQEAKHRMDVLRQIPAAVRFVSGEPLLEDLGTVDLTGIGWFITGGESGPGARPALRDWFRAIRDQCQSAGVAYFHKQNGEWAPFWDFEFIPSPNIKTIKVGNETMWRIGKNRAGRMLDGRTWDDFPVISS